MTRRFATCLAILWATPTASMVFARDEPPRLIWKGRDAQAKIKQREALMKQEPARGGWVGQKGKPIPLPRIVPDAVARLETLTVSGTVFVNNERIQFNQSVTLVTPDWTKGGQDDPDGEVERDHEVDARENRNGLLCYAVAEENFDIFAFGLGIGEDERRSRLAAILEDKVDYLARRHHLTDAERAKLRLAGKGDIKHLFDDIDASRRRFNDVREDFLKGARALEGVQMLSSQFKDGPFFSGSLFAKTLQKIRADRPGDHP